MKSPSTAITERLCKNCSEGKINCEKIWFPPNQKSEIWISGPDFLHHKLGPTAINVQTTGKNMKGLLQNLARKVSSRIYVHLLLRDGTAHSPFGADAWQIKCTARVRSNSHKETNGGWHTAAAWGLGDQGTYRWRDRAVGEVGVGQHEEGITRIRRRLVHASILVLRHWGQHKENSRWWIPSSTHLLQCL